MALSQIHANLITAFITILTATSPFLLTVINENFFIKNKPNILHTENSRNDPYDNITIVNEGSIPLINLKAILKAPTTIENIIFSNTTDFTIRGLKNESLYVNISKGEPIPYNSSTIQLNIPKLMPGNGDYVKLDLSMNRENNTNLDYSDIEYILVYNNGSLSGTTKYKDLITQFLDVFKNSFNITAGILVLPVLALLFIFIYIPIITKGYQREFLRNIRKDVIDTIFELEKDIETKDEFFYRERGEWNKQKDNHKAKKEKGKDLIIKYIFWGIYYDKRSILDFKDYYLINEFYEKTGERESILENLPYKDYIKRIEEENETLKKELNELVSQYKTPISFIYKEEMKKYIDDGKYDDIIQMNIVLVSSAQRIMQEIDWKKYFYDKKNTNAST
jgi:hypothetical protein